MKTASQKLFVCKKCGSIHDGIDGASAKVKELQCPSCGSQSKVALKTNAGQELISRFQKFTSDFAYLNRESNSYE